MPRPTATTGFVLFDDAGLELVVDATMSEGHRFQADVPEHEVEHGAAVADHRRRKLVELELTGAVSTSPARQTRDQSETRDVDFFGRIIAAFARDEAVWTVVTGLRVYESMALVDASVPRAPLDGEVLNVSLKFREIRFVSAITTGVPASIIRAQERDRSAEPTENAGEGGTASGTDVSDDEAASENASTLAAQIVNSTFDGGVEGLFGVQP